MRLFLARPFGSFSGVNFFIGYLMGKGPSVFDVKEEVFPRGPFPVGVYA